MRILTFDPSSSLMGYAVIDIDINSFTVVKYGLIKRNLLLKQRDKSFRQIFSDQYCFLDVLQDHLSYIVDTYKPELIVSEDAFKGAFAKPYAALILVINTVRRVSHLKLGIDIVTYPPKQVKSYATNDGEADKEGVKKAILSNEFIQILEDPDHPKDSLTDHEYDAIAVGYTYYLMSKK